MKNAYLFVLLSILVAGQCLKWKLTIRGPKELIDFNGGNEIKMRVAGFGTVPWAQTRAGRVYVANPLDACDTIPKLKSEKDPNDKAPIMIAVKGGCNPAIKAQNAQHAGAKVLIIIDDNDEIYQQYEMFEEDTGFGNNIHIPTLLINKKIGEKIKDMSKDLGKAHDRRVFLSAHFDTQKSEKVTYEAWLVASNLPSYKFVHDFASYGQRLSNMTTFTPHWVLWYSPQAERSNWTIPIPDCVSNGRYCSPDPDGATGPASGRDVIYETLRQICLRDLMPNSFWQYGPEFYRICLNNTRGLHDLKKCSDSILTKLKIDQPTLQKCIDESFEGADQATSDNKLLRAERQLFNKKKPLGWPVLFINDLRYHGEVNANKVLEGICNSFLEEHPLCYTINFKDKKTSHDPTDYKPNGRFWMTFGIILVLLVVFLGVFYFVYRRLVRQQLATELAFEVNQTVSKYVAMNDAKEIKSAAAKESA